MNVVFLNAPILTAEGTWSYKKTTLDFIKMFIKNERPRIISAIGHEATAEILSDLLKRVIPYNRINYEQKKDDMVFVFKLKSRPPEGKILTRSQAEKIGYEFYTIQAFNYTTEL